MAIDIMAAFESEPPALDFVLPGFLAGTVGALVAPGASGKSFWTLEAAMSVACSVAGGDLLGLSPTPGHVVYMAGEDPEIVLQHRLHAIGSRLSLGARQSIAQRLMIESVMGSRIDVMNDRHLSRIIEYCYSARLIIFDTLSRIHNLDENSNGDMSRLVSTLEHIAKKTGAAVLYLHHVSKGAVRNGGAAEQQAARGASALIDNARWCGYVARMSESEAAKLSDRAFDRAPVGPDRRRFFIKWGVSKSNYDEMPPEQWFQFGEGGVLAPADLVEPGGKAAKGVRREEA